MPVRVQYLMYCVVLMTCILQTVSSSFNNECFCEPSPVCEDLAATYICTNKSLEFESPVVCPQSNYSDDSKAEHLKELKISKCTLKDFKGYSLEKLAHLETLDLTGTFNPDIFGLNLRNTSLKVLTLSQCNLNNSDVDSLNKFLLHTPHLKHLNLSGNNFEKLDDLSFSEVNLEVLDLSGNNLTALPPQLPEGLQTLKLKGVELICNCSWMKGISLKVEPSDLKCKNSVDLIGVNEFVSKCQHVEDPDVQTQHTNSSLVVVIVILVLVLVAAVIGCFAHRIVTNRRRRSQEKKAVRYSAVYRETVETSAPSSRTTMETKA